MFAKAPERRMVTVRLVILVAWATLVVSLFWDPLTIWLTEPDSGTPFALKSTPVEVQGQVLEQQPYAMGARMFWTMVLPLVPMFLMIFGHEAWRRICPLSFASRIPYYLGFQLLRKSFNRITGRVERKAAIISPNSFLARWHTPMQFIFLASGVTARLLFTNSDRSVLAIFFISIISAAILVGTFFGGKTWCNYFCPIAPMQKVYTAPRGFLESQAHNPKTTISQSMCRTSGKDGDQSACVACSSPCPDIDLERSYWETSIQPGSRFTYYGYSGMVLGFYVYYYLFSGGWDYYFSGAWTHEQIAQTSQLWRPGFFINGISYAIPKIFAAPLSMALFIAGAYGFWRLVEVIYGAIARKINPRIEYPQIRHRMLMVCAWTTFNTFYFFAGRPNIALMPIWLQTTINTLIVFISTAWMVRNIMRKASDHTDESLASALRGRLKQSVESLQDYTRGRHLEDLSAAEVNIIAKIAKRD